MTVPSCPACGSDRLDVTGGARMRLIDMEIEGQLTPRPSETERRRPT